MYSIKDFIELQWCENFVHIPCGWWVSKEDRERIVSIIRKG